MQSYEGITLKYTGGLLDFDTSDHVMFIGADLNHPKTLDCPCITAVVGTMNWPAANRYAARVSPQNRGDIIINFGKMCLHLVDAYHQTNNVRPAKIVVFRDGVGDGEFKKVLEDEVDGLKKEVWNDDYNPPITVIVAQKWHRTRLFPIDKNNGDKWGNVPPGTMVDTEIVDSHSCEFYMCSHSTAFGVSKPIHYTVILNENNFTSEVLQKLTHHLCFTLERCTNPISVVPPVFYADLVAYRGRMFQEAISQNPETSTSNPLDQTFYDLHEDMLNDMFFV